MSYDVFEPWKSSRVAWWHQAITCWLGTAHSWKTDMNSYDGDYTKFQSARKGGEGIVYVCRFCSKRKLFW